MFAELAPECAGRIDAMCNGVDADFFEPESARQSPFPAGEKAVVFTGAMDYWPNVDGVTWFVTSVLPHLRLLGVPMRFYIVGRAPAAAVLALAGTDVVVTGTVADVRPYLQYAAVIVAPLRVARGIQNKILEAMAMGKAVVASEACAAALDALRDRDYLAAGTAEEFAGRVGELLNAPERAATIGTAAREAVLAQYSWTAHLRGIDAYLDDENLPRAAMGQA